MLKWETNITPDDEGLGDDYSSYSYHGTLVDVISVAYQIVYVHIYASYICGEGQCRMTLKKNCISIY